MPPAVTVVLAELTAEGYALIVTAVFAGLGGLVTGVVNLVLGYKREKDQKDRDAAREAAERDIKEKIDANTTITKVGTKAAAAAVVKVAEVAEVAGAAKAEAEAVNRKLNGGVDAAVAAAVAPISRSLEEHAQTDERNMREITAKFEALTEYVHRRNHDVLDALQTLSNRTETIVVALGLRQQQQQQSPAPPPAGQQ